MKLSEIDIIMREEIEPSLKIVNHLFPKKKKNIDSPYTEIIKINGNSAGLYGIIQMTYNEAAFEVPPNTRDFSEGFRIYYQLVSDSQSIPKTREKDGRIAINIPYRDPTVAAVLDTKNKLVSFGYKKQDERAQLVMGAYIKKFMNS